MTCANHFACIIHCSWVKSSGLYTCKILGAMVARCTLEHRSLLLKPWVIVERSYLHWHLLLKCENYWKSTNPGLGWKTMRHVSASAVMLGLLDNQNLSIKPYPAIRSLIPLWYWMLLSLEEIWYWSHLASWVELYIYNEICPILSYVSEVFQDFQKTCASIPKGYSITMHCFATKARAPSTVLQSPAVTIILSAAAARKISPTLTVLPHTTTCCLCLQCFVPTFLKCRNDQKWKWHG